MAEHPKPAAVVARLAELYGAPAAAGNVPVTPEGGSLWRRVGWSWRSFPELPNTAAFAAMLSIAEIAP